MKVDLNKYADGLHGTVRVGKQFVKVVYVKAMERSLTTSATTVQVHWTMCQLGWYLGQQTGVVNHLPNLDVLKRLF